MRDEDRISESQAPPNGPQHLLDLLNVQILEFNAISKNFSEIGPTCSVFHNGKNEKCTFDFFTSTRLECKTVTIKKLIASTNGFFFSLMLLDRLARIVDDSKLKRYELGIACIRKATDYLRELYEGSFIIVRQFDTRIVPQDEMIETIFGNILYEAAEARTNRSKFMVEGTPTHDWLMEVKNVLKNKASEINASGVCTAEHQRFNLTVGYLLTCHANELSHDSEGLFEEYCAVVSGYNNAPAMTFSRDFKPNTTVSSLMPTEPTGYFVRKKLREEITSALLKHHEASLHSPELPVPVIVVWAPGGFGKSTEVIMLVQQCKVWGKFPGGVYFVDCSYEFGNEKILLEKLAKQIFARYVQHNSVEGLVEALGRDIAAKRKSILVVLDNVVETSLVAWVEKVVGKWGAVIITARDGALWNGSENFQVPELSKDEMVQFLSCSDAHISGVATERIDAVLEHTYGVPLALSLVCKLSYNGDSFDSINERINNCDGDVNIEGFDPKRLRIEKSYHKSTFACIAVSVYALKEDLRHKLELLVLLPIGLQVPAKMIAVLWGEQDTELSLVSLNNASLIVFDRTHQVLRLHDLVRRYLERRLKVHDGTLPRVQAHLNLLAAHIVSSGTIGPLILRQKDLLQELGVYFRHWDYLTALMAKGNVILSYPPPFELVRAHSEMLQQSPENIQVRCQYAHQSSVMLRALGETDAKEMPLLQQAVSNIDALCEGSVQSPLFVAMRACKAEVLDKIADLMGAKPESGCNMAAVRTKQLNLFKEARDLKAAAIGKETVEYCRSLNSIGLIVEQLLVLHLETHPDANGFDRTQLDLALAAYSEAREILQRLIDQRKAGWFRLGVIAKNIAVLKGMLSLHEEAQEDFRKANEYFLESKDQAEDGANPKFAFSVCANMGIDHYYAEKYPEARSLLTQAREYCTQNHFPSTHDYVIKIEKHLTLLNMVTDEAPRREA